MTKSKILNNAYTWLRSEIPSAQTIEKLEEKLKAAAEISGSVSSAEVLDKLRSAVKKDYEYRTDGTVRVEEKSGYECTGHESYMDDVQRGMYHRPTCSRQSRGIYKRVDWKEYRFSFEKNWDLENVDWHIFLKSQDSYTSAESALRQLYDSAFRNRHKELRSNSGEKVSVPSEKENGLIKEYQTELVKKTVPFLLDIAVQQPEPAWIEERTLWMTGKDEYLFPQYFPNIWAAHGKKLRSDFKALAKTIIEGDYSNNPLGGFHCPSLHEKLAADPTLLPILKEFYDDPIGAYLSNQHFPQSALSDLVRLGLRPDENQSIKLQRKIACLEIKGLIDGVTEYTNGDYADSSPRVEHYLEDITRNLSSEAEKQNWEVFEQFYSKIIKIAEKSSWKKYTSLITSLIKSLPAEIRRKIISEAIKDYSTRSESLSRPEIDLLFEHAEGLEDICLLIAENAIKYGTGTYGTGKKSNKNSTRYIEELITKVGASTEIKEAIGCRLSDAVESGENLLEFYKFTKYFKKVPKAFSHQLKSQIAEELSNGNRLKWLSDCLNIGEESIDKNTDEVDKDSTPEQFEYIPSILNLLRAKLELEEKNKLITAEIEEKYRPIKENKSDLENQIQSQAEALRNSAEQENEEIAKLFDR